MNKNILISLPEDVAAALSARARRYGLSRRALVQGLCWAFVSSSRCGDAPQGGIENEVEQMLNEYADAETPRYGERTIRRFNKGM